MVAPGCGKWAGSIRKEAAEYKMGWGQGKEEAGDIYGERIRNKAGKRVKRSSQRAAERKVDGRKPLDDWWEKCGSGQRNKAAGWRND